MAHDADFNAGLESDMATEVRQTVGISNDTAITTRDVWRYIADINGWSMDLPTEHIQQLEREASQAFWRRLIPYLKATRSIPTLEEAKRELSEAEDTPLSREKLDAMVHNVPQRARDRTKQD